MMINWPEFIRKHNIYINSLPTSWKDAPHFGNAMVGSMWYMRDDKLTMEVFRADVRDHRDESYGWTAYRAPHLRVGYFTLETVGTPTACNWCKDLWDAELTGTITTDKGEISIRHLTHSEDMVIITELTPSEGEKELRWTWHPVEAKTTRGGYPTDDESQERFAKRYGQHYAESIKPSEDNPAGRLQADSAVTVWIQDLLAGGQYATAWSQEEAGPTHTHIVSITKSYPETTAAREAVSNVNSCLKSHRNTWIEHHRAWWHTYYPQSYISIPDKRLESLYWQTIYRYGCNSRAGRYYVDTSGLWFQGAQWPYTTNDWNTQSAHWAVYAANRLEQGEEVVNCLHAGMQNMIDAVLPEEWQEDSAYLHLATPSDMSGTRRSDMRYYDCVGCLPWLMHNAWWHYRFSMDDDLLRETIFPLLRRAVNLYFHLSYKDDDGRIHLKPTYSPETNTHGDANFDLSLFKWGCHILLKASKRLEINDPLSSRWEDVTENLVSFPADENGYQLAKDVTPWPGHRHLSHLLMIYPLYLVNIEQNDTTDILSRSYASADEGDGSDGGAMEELVAMVQAHAGTIGTALGEGDKALAGLQGMVAEFTPTGLWPCGNNPCIESTLTMANIIQDMLLQSWSDPALDDPGPIRVFPALPSDWNEVEFHNLRAEGAFLVSAKREGGVTQWIRVKSLAGEPCRLKTGMVGFRVEGSRNYAVVEDNGIIEIDLKKGEELVLLRSI
ncbi:MAG: glycosyl hydrolase family 95 catalytic domain-containing protein [Planctomycetota bacterium]